ITRGFDRLRQLRSTGRGLQAVENRRQKLAIGAAQNYRRADRVRVRASRTALAVPVGKRPTERHTAHEREMVYHTFPAPGVYVLATTVVAMSVSHCTTPENCDIAAFTETWPAVTFIWLA